MFARALLYLTVTLLCAAPTVSAAATDEEAQQRARIRFAAMDSNNDGVISRNEWRGSARSFEVHDWNGDGELSGDEIRIGAQRNTNFEYADHNPSRAEQFLSWTEAGFNNLDHNRDRRITVNEWHFDIQTFRRVDRNRDDALNRAEFLGGETDDLRGDRFEDIDVNNNGRVERREWYGSADAFDWLDRNNDGVLTRAEVVGDQDANRPLDQFASLDIDDSGTIERDEWHWSRISFNDRDVNRDGVISRREFTATGGAPSSTPTTAGGTVVINPQARWTDTGLNVRAGDVLSFRADGQIQMSTNPEDIATPAGARSGRMAPDAPIANAVAGALIARFGDSAPVLIGNRGTFTAPVSGRLYLGVNDDHLLDNQGEYRVHVEARGRTTR